MLILVIIGWVLFAFTAILYFVGNRLNAKETNALAIYSLGLLMNDSVRDATRIELQNIIEAHPEMETSELTYRLILVTTQAAKSTMEEGVLGMVIARIDENRAGL